jgi:predicted metal-dependent HD superfamily phosphohydrolase
MSALRYASRSPWDQLWSRWGVAGDTASWFERIGAAHAKPSRHYHNLQHVDYSLQLVEQHADLATDPDAVRAAFWFHDAVYDSMSRTNEKDSAALFQLFAQTHALPPERTEEVVRLIELTVGHEVSAGDDNGALMVDVDLAILGADSEVYRNYAAGIRAEYAAVSDEDYVRGRCEVLARFLSRAVIFHHLPLRERFEQPARRNLQAEINKLASLP